MSNIVKISELTDEEKEKWKKHVQETLPTVRNVKDSSAVELQSSDTPIVSKADPRLRMARKRLTEYTAEDYNTASKLASINQRKYSNIINNMADKNPVGAFLLNAEMNLANGMNQSVMGINNAINTIGASATKGIENIAKFTNNTDLENRARDTYNKRIAEGNYLDIASKFISGGNQGINNGVIRTGGNVASTIGNQLMSAGLGGSTGLSGSTTQAIGVAGSSAQEVLNENKDNIVQALITGGTKGYLSKKIEDVFDANILTGGSKKTSIQKQVNNWIANSFKSNTGKLIAQNVSGVLGENAEEFLEDNLGNIIDKFVNNKDLPSFEEWWNNTTETAKTTTLTTIVMQLLGFGGGDIDTEVDSDVDFWTKEAQKIVNDKSIQNNTQNIQQNQANNQRNIQEKQIAQIENNVAQNQNMERIYTENVKPQLDNILNNKELPMQSYIYEKSTNKKINTLREDASKYFNNSEKAHNYMKMLEKIIEDKDINIRLDANLKTADGRVANGSYSNGSITINPNSTRTGEFIAVHELTHAIGTKEMLNMVENYRKSNVEFDNSVKKLLNNYNSTEITEEALSDVSAQLFGTQEFINNVAQNNPNIFQKLYSEIKYLWHQFRGYKNQDQFIDDLYYKWTQAYNNSDKLNKSSSFSIQINSDGSKYVQVDTDQNIFEGIDKKDYNKIAKMYMQDYLMGKTQLSDNDNAIIDRKSANKYTNPGKKQQNFDKKMQLTPELKNVLEIAQIDSVSAPTKDTSKYRNWEYYKFKFELSGKKFEGTVNIGIDSDGNKHFYEINKIKEVDDISGKNLNRSSASSINNSIASGNKDVNTTAKYSMQESENNSGPNENWQSYLEDNYKSDGTKTNLQDIKLPTAPKQVAPSMANNKLSKASDTKNEDIPDTREYLTEKRTKDKVSFSEIKDTLAQRLVNKGHYIDKLAEKTGNNELKYKYDRTMNSFNEAQISIGEHQVDSNGKVVGKSLLEIFQPAKDMNLKTEFEDYLANKHNISRDAVGKNIYGGEVTAPQSSEIVKKYEESHPEFKQWSEEVSKYNDNNLRDLVNSGMVSENLYNNLKEMYGDYVPIYRDIVSNMQEYSDDKVGGNTLKRATKSGKEILSIEESMAEQTLAIKKAIRINEVGVELAKTLGKDSVILDNINFDPIAIETLGGDVISKAEDGTNIFTIFQNGEMSHFKISDEIYSAFAKNTIENRINNSKVAKAMLTPVAKLSETQRNILTTYSVGFAMKNPITDLQEAVFNTKYSTATFSKNYLKALYNLGTNGEWAQSYMNNGGNANTYFDYSKGLLPTKQNVVKKVANKILQVNEVLEQAPRLAEYISTIENGGTINEALYNAADITTNFKRGGDITKAVNKYGVNFLNASVQGLDKVYRNITGKNGVKGYANLLVKATMFQIAPAILNGLILGDDDDYDKLPEYTKDNYFLIKMSDGRFFRIPKGRVSSVVGGIARRALEKVQGKEVDWSSIVDTTVNQLAPNNPLTDNIVAPIIQAKNNKTWYGGDLVSSRLKKLPEAEQYDESTDSLSKFIGEKLNISPKKLNYVLDQYSGGIGDVILPMMTPQAENNIIEDKFTTDSVMKNKNVSKYYSTLEELEKKKNSVNVTDEDKLKYKYMYDATEDLSGLYKQKREIQKSDINDNEKKTKVREIQKQINNIVEEKLNGLNSLSANGTTGKVGDSEYYQSEGKWTSLSEKDEEKNANISLETYANYKNTVKQLTNEKRQNGELKDTEQLKDKDKIQILLNSKYSDKEKSAIYEEYILNPNNSTYNVMKSAGINIDEWLKYSKQEFTSDKKDDGTVNGSTVSGSKKKKVYAYIENMNITYSQKLLLKGMQYSLTDSEKSKVDNYIRKLNISNSEKLDILGKIKGFTIYKDNTYSY